MMKFSAQILTITKNMISVLYSQTQKEIKTGFYVKTT